MASLKLIVVIGATGKQGRSVVDAFLKDRSYRVRGITRNPESSSAVELASLGVEVVGADTSDESAIENAFQAAHTIFAVTDYWASYRKLSEDHASVSKEKSLLEQCYDIEVQSGINIANAASRIASLERFIFSSLPSPKAITDGKYTHVYHFDSKAHIADYIQDNLPSLWKKTSQLWMGSYLTNWSVASALSPRRAEDGVYELRSCGEGYAKLPLVDAKASTGRFVYALAKNSTPLQTTLLGAGKMMSKREYLAEWGRVYGVKTKYVVITVEECDAMLPGGIGIEVAASANYVSEFGWCGEAIGKGGFVMPQDLGVDESATIGRYIRETDWSSILG